MFLLLSSSLEKIDFEVNRREEYSNLARTFVDASREQFEYYN